MHRELRHSRPSWHVPCVRPALLQMRPGTVMNCGVMLFNVGAVGAGLGHNAQALQSLLRHATGAAFEADPLPAFRLRAQPMHYLHATRCSTLRCCQPCWPTPTAANGTCCTTRQVA